MVTFRIILAGILSLVPNKPWSESPTAVWVLSHSGKPSGACPRQAGAGHSAPHGHDLILLFDPAQVDPDQPRPDSAFRLASRRCPPPFKEDPFAPLKEVLVVKDQDLWLVLHDSTSTLRLPAGQLQIFEGAAATATAPANGLGERNKLSRVVALGELVKGLTIDPSCLAFPISPKSSCGPALGARLKLEAGLLHARSESRRWSFQPAGAASAGGVSAVREVTVAAEAALQAPVGATLTVCGRPLYKAPVVDCDDPHDACGCDDAILSLKPPRDGQEVVLTFDNSPIASLVTAVPCPEAPEQGPPHAALIYDLAESCVPEAQRLLPRPVAKPNSTGGDHSVNPDLCNPVNTYPPPKDPGGPG